MKIILPQETLSVIKERHVFIDTCLLLDFASLRKHDKEKLFDMLHDFTDKNLCVLVTVEPVEKEFLLGAGSSEDLSVKKSYLSQLVEIVLPLATISSDTIEELILEYGEYARGTVSYTDLYLASAIKKFSGSLLLTRNYKDFPLKIFNCRAIFTLHFNNDLRTYCFYEYGKEEERSREAP